MLKNIKQLTSTSVVRYYCSIPLVKPMKIKKRGQEITLYIKGFMSKGEKSEDFHKWIANHHKLVLKHGWNETCYGYNWDTGSLKHPLPMISGTNVAYMMTQGSKLFRANPWTFVKGAVIDIGFYVFLMMYQYHTIEQNTELLSSKLALDLIKFSSKYNKVRIVAHSLGCKLLMNALADVPDKYKPDVIHMCAPAFSEEKYGDKLDNLAKRGTYIYYTPEDTILSRFLQALKNRQPVGAYGLAREYEKIKTIDVTKYFESYWTIHNNYNRVFHKFIENDNNILKLESKTYKRYLDKKNNDDVN